MFKQLAEKAEDNLQNCLPQYMLPNLWVPVSSWPLNMSGKTDRRRLTAGIEELAPEIILEYQRTSINDADHDKMNSKMDPMTQIEKIIEETWKEVLKKTDDTILTPHDNFFRLGGDSLTTIMLISRLKAKGLHITAQEIFTAKTLRNMANRISFQNPGSNILQDYSMGSKIMETDGQQGSISAAKADSAGFAITSKDIPPILVDDLSIEDVYPASHMQLVFLIEGQKWCRSYYAWSFIDIGKSATIERVQETCTVITQRHPILRTSFHLVGRECYQVVRKVCLDFKVLFAEFNSERWCTELDEDVEHPTCFGQILTRFRLLIDPLNGRQVLALGLSHAQYDGFCLPTILNDLSLAYIGKLRHSPSPPSYKSFIQHTLLLCNDKTDAFWRDTLGKTLMTFVADAPTLNTRPIMSRSLKRIIPFEFKHSGIVSYPAMLKVAWALTLSQISSALDITFGNVVSGRFATFQGAQDVVGLCLNFIPVRVRINVLQSFNALLKEVFDQQVAAIPFEATPFYRIANQTSWSTETRFNSIFQFQNLPDSEDEILAGSDWKIAGNAVYGGGLLQSGACWLMAWPHTDGTAQFRLTYSEETMNTNKAEALLELFFKILRRVNDDLDANVASALAIPSEAKIAQHQHQLLENQSVSTQSQSPTESFALVLEQMSFIWRTVLCCTNVHPRDSFFDLGGDSISAAEMSSRCANIGLILSMQDIIDFPELESQVVLLTRNTKSKRGCREMPKLLFSENHKFN
jgi:aryl carrier-like protein